MVTNDLRDEEQEEFKQKIKEMTYARVPTYEVKIYTGLKEGYNGWVHPIDDVDRVCQAYCNKVRLCVTVTETHYIYVDGAEPGAVIGLINYPRYPSPPYKIKEHAFNLAEKLLLVLKQKRCNIVTPELTYLLENPMVNG